MKYSLHSEVCVLYVNIKKKKLKINNLISGTEELFINIMAVQ